MNAWALVAAVTMSIAAIVWLFVNPLVAWPFAFSAGLWWGGWLRG